ncbi:MAG: hypothetical protein WCG05_00170 [Alphaproteobacteria bacterium]
MKLKLLAFVFFLAMQGVAATQDPDFKELPVDKVLSLNDQEELFVKAYDAVGSAEIHPTETIIPGLAPMIRMHYSYVAKLVEHSPKHLELLKDFWQKVSKVIESNQLTIARMRSITMQLAFLLTDMQGTPVEELAHCKNLYEDGNWQDLDTYKDPFSYWLITSYPFENHLKAKDLYREAILCCKGGGFSFDRFVRNYLDRPLPLNLGALSLKCKGAHGGNVCESGDFLWHDFNHTNEFVYTMLCEEIQAQKKPNIFQDYPILKEKGFWNIEKELLGKIYRSAARKDRNMAALFLMLHENHPSLINSSQPWLGDEALPLSERRLFWGLVSNITTEEYALSTLVYGSFFGGVSGYPLPLQYYALRSQIRNIKNIGSVETIVADIHYHVSDLTYKNIGTFSLDLVCKPGTEDWAEHQFVSNVSNITWKPDFDVLSLEEKSFINQHLLSSSAEERYGRKRSIEYRQFAQDYEEILRSVYGAEFLPSETQASLGERVMAIESGMKRFWEEFYMENRELFSDKLFEVA